MSVQICRSAHRRRRHHPEGDPEVPGGEGQAGRKSRKVHPVAAGSEGTDASGQPGATFPGSLLVQPGVRRRPHSAV